jgi:hypothetical protein
LDLIEKENSKFPYILTKFRFFVLSSWAEIYLHSAMQGPISRYLAEITPLKKLIYMWISLLREATRIKFCINTVDPLNSHISKVFERLISCSKSGEIESTNAYYVFLK